MIIQSLKKHFPARFPEWLASFQLMVWGSYLVLNPSMFIDPRLGQMYNNMLNMWPQAQWALFAIFIGFTRACALFINGAYTRTPVIRIITAFMSAFIWTQALIGISTMPNLGVVMYLTALISDICSAYRAGIDAVFAEHQRRVESQRVVEKAVIDAPTTRARFALD